MKLTGRLGASLVLFLTLSAAAGLFYYAQQFKKESVQTLQEKVRELEMQRLEEDRGKQLLVAVQKGADRFNELVAADQKRIEALAESKPFRQPHNRPALRAAKIKAFQQIGHPDSSWISSAITDEAGTILAAFPNAATQPIGQTKEFKEAAKQRMTVLQIVEHRGAYPGLQVTVPCLSDRGDLLGVLQVEAALSPAVFEKLVPQSGLTFLLATANGRRLSGSEGLPAFLNPKNQGTTDNLLTHAGAPTSFKLQNKDAEYLAAPVETRIPGVWLFALLGVSGLESLVGGPTSDTPFNDPIILGGLPLILVLGLLLTLLLAGGNGGVKQLNNTLGTLLQEDEAKLLPINGPSGREWQKLTDYINLIIDRASGTTGASSAGRNDTGDSRAMSRLNGELVELRQARDQIVAQNQELLDKIDNLARQNQQLRDTQNKPMAEAGPTPEPVVPPEETSQIRIDAIINMSEDLKATLTVIKNYISAILSSEEGKITDAQQEFLGVVINKSARLERQINDLLDLSHLEKESHDMYMVPAEMSALMQDVILNTQPQADTKQIRLLQDIPSNLPPILINSDRLGQVFINLMQHALRATPVGGTVKIEVRSGPDTQVVKIMDEGTSLTRDQAEIMFTMFQGAESKAGASAAGSGLRFAIVKKIIDAHHGTISMRGLANQGNETVITLPVQPGGAVDPHAHIDAEARKENSETESFFDLSSFMQDKSEDEAPKPQVPGATEDLDELLKNIENVEGQEA